MSKLLRLKLWVSLSAAAHHLSIMVGEPVSEADILRLALDRHISLSVNLVNGATARQWVPVDPAGIEWETVPGLTGGEVHLPKGGAIRSTEDGRTLQCIDQVRDLAPGIWDLPMLGAEAIELERQFQRLSEGPDCTMISTDGAFISSTDGSLFELLAPSESNPKNHYPADALPSDSVLVVRTASLLAFHEGLNSSPSPARKANAYDYSTRECETLLKLVAGMAVAGYGHSPEASRSDAPTEIAHDLGKLGISLTDDTVRKWLKVACGEVLPRKAKDE